MDYNNYTAFRCLVPTRNITGSPMLRIYDACPCDINYNNISGRGFLPCTYGVSFEEKKDEKDNNIEINGSDIRKMVGSLFNNNNYTPPNLDPRPIARIGNILRSSN